MEIISLAFRLAFRDYCSNYLVLRTIHDIFADSGIQRGEMDPAKLVRLSGARRGLIEEYYASIDWSSHKDVQKFLKVLSVFFKLYAPDENNHLRKMLIDEGFKIDRNIVSFSNKRNSGEHIKNLIFAANGPKPEIVLLDALTNEIQIARNGEYCLIYERPILDHGLLWKDLMDWWNDSNGNNSSKTLHDRLYKSLASEPEKLLFSTYFLMFSHDEMPALIPQVYLHYDPRTLKQLSGEKWLIRQRMDFLMLLPNDIRIVLEVDGKQHYSSQNELGHYIASPELYAEMVSEDRRLKLAGYEIYRFGGRELYGSQGENITYKFFQDLFQYHSIKILDYGF